MDLTKPSTQQPATFKKGFFDISGQQLVFQGEHIAGEIKGGWPGLYSFPKTVYQWTSLKLPPSRHMLSLESGLAIVERQLLLFQGMDLALRPPATQSQDLK